MTDFEKEIQNGFLQRWLKNGDEICWRIHLIVTPDDPNTIEDDEVAVEAFGPTPESALALAKNKTKAAHVQDRAPDDLATLEDLETGPGSIYHRLHYGSAGVQ